jgi:hypothetical protein
MQRAGKSLRDWTKHVSVSLLDRVAPSPPWLLPNQSRSIRRRKLKRQMLICSLEMPCPASYALPSPALPSPALPGPSLVLPAPASPPEAQPVPLQRQSCRASPGEDGGAGKQRGPLFPLTNGSIGARVYRDLLHRWLLPVLARKPAFSQDIMRRSTPRRSSWLFRTLQYSARVPSC